MTRRFTAGVATGILIATGLAGVTAATLTSFTTAASPSKTPAAAHKGASAGTRQAANLQRGAVLRSSGGQIAISGDAGAGMAIARKGGAFTVTAINGNTITARLNGPSIAGGPFIMGGPGPIGAPGSGFGAVVPSTATVTISPTQVFTDMAPGGPITATTKGFSFSGGPFMPGKPGAIRIQGFGLGGDSALTVTISVSNATVYTRAGRAAGLSDIQVGSVLDVQGTPTSNGTLAASAIEIVLPQRTGVVTAINGNSLTVTGFDARSYTITVGGDTTYRRADQTAALSDVAVGSLISAEGTPSSDGSTLNALAVTIQLPRVAGQVTAVSGNTVTVKAPDGTTSTVTLTDATTYSAGPQGTAGKSSITTGSFIMAEGTIGGDGALTALHVDVATGLDTGTDKGMSFGFAPPPGAGLQGAGPPGAGAISFGDAATSAGSSI